ncbi:MAG: hypothetical protein ACF8SC_04350 [Phycisphaerales bacterium JB037]
MSGSGSQGVSDRTLAGWSLSAAAIGAIGLIAWGVWEQDLGLVAFGMLGLIAVGAAAPVALKGGSGGGGDGLALRELADAVRHLQEEQALSDDARRVLNRRRERELLCQAIEEDIAAEDWDAALVLVRELAESFGYRADAEEFRTRIDSARYETLERRVGAAVRGLDRVIAEQRWEAADAEAARIARLYPDSPRVDGLRHRVEEARLAYKHDLERRFLQAAQGERIDEAMELLKELDAYLTEQEGARFQELARGVIGKARENLGAQFKLAVHDRRWRHAAQLGERIIDEFPNSRMAEEVRGLIDGIRSKSAAMSG